MTRFARLGLVTALTGSLLALTACGGALDDEATAQSTPDVTVTAPVSDSPRSSVPTSTGSAARSSSEETSVVETPVPAGTAAPQPTVDLGMDDVLFLSNITEFTLMERTTGEQIRLGRSMCSSLRRGLSKADVTAEHLEAGRYNRAEVTNVLVAATVAYCPEFD